MMVEKLYGIQGTMVSMNDRFTVYMQKNQVAELQQQQQQQQQQQLLPRRVPRKNPAHMIQRRQMAWRNQNVRRNQHVLRNSNATTGNQNASGSATWPFRGHLIAENLLRNQFMQLRTMLRQRNQMGINANGGMRRGFRGRGRGGVRRSNYNTVNATAAQARLQGGGRIRAVARGGRGRGRGRGGVARQQQPRVRLSREQLDKELEQYMACTKSALDKQLDEYMMNADMDPEPV